MNRITTISSIAMFAIVLGLGVVSPAMAAPNDNANEKAKVGKGKVCHWQEEVLDLTDPENPVVVEEAKWVVNDISKNAHKAHVDVHTDGTLVDILIDDDEPFDPDTITSVACEERNNP